MHINNTSQLKTGKEPACRSIPILFRGEMVQAILNTRPDRTPINTRQPIKWQTRRVVKPSQSNVTPLELSPWIVDREQEVDKNDSPIWLGTHPDYPTGTKWFSCPYGASGDELWVREAWAYAEAGMMGRSQPAQYIYKADYPPFSDSGLGGWKPSIHMPRQACRLTLKVLDVRVERIQSISPTDCQAEGIAVYQGEVLVPAGSDKLTDSIYLDQFVRLWESVNGSRDMGWSVNPWCWVIEFEVLA